MQEGTKIAIFRGKLQAFLKREFLSERGVAEALMFLRCIPDSSIATCPVHRMRPVVEGGASCRECVEKKIREKTIR